ASKNNFHKPTINSELLPTQRVMQRCMMDGSLLNLFREELPIMLSLQAKKREKDLQYFEDKVLLMKAKERGEVLDAEAEAFLADVECDEPYDEPLAITTTTAFNVDHENAYDSNVDEDPHAAAAFMANITSAEGTSGTSSEVIKEVVQIVIWYLDLGCSRHMIGDRSKLINYVDKFIGTVRFGNDEFATIVGYGLEVAFRQHSCYIRNKDMVELMQGSSSTNLYSISLNNLMAASPVCLLSKASSTKSWLWHRRLTHLNFGTLNELAQKDLVRGLPRLKYDKEHLCPSCQLG
nr:hypothetical protein [Tanacetum cinerariifolium]